MINRTQFSWACYDWANSAFATTVLVGLFPVLFNNYYAAGVDPGMSTFYLGAFGNSLSAAVVMVLAPTLGVIADRRGLKKPLLGLFTGLGVAGTVGLFFVGEGQWGWAIALFSLACIGFFGGLGFYDSLLVNVAAPAERDRVSAFGYGLGYLGGGLLFVLNVLMVLKPEMFGIPDKSTAAKLAFVSVGAWWILFSLPLFLKVPEPEREEGGAMGWREMALMMKRVLGMKPVLMFLLGYFLYIDAVGTVAQMAVDFGIKLGFASDALIKAILIVQFVSFPAAIAFGWIGERFGTRHGIYLGLAVYVFVTCWALFMKTERDFYLMAAVVGLVQGGVQSLSRSYFARLIPADSAGQFFGFYNMLGKFAAVLGPLVVGITAALTGNPRLSLFMLVFFFIGGAVLLSRVREPALPVAA
ncbi:UMF1 family MFS transporter [Panacagrimonas perspica]|uniref:UMF1 family MFS transporter n=1 Tax=Panacagrimonas perspica TaxID=381431 RepID=A0A4R7PFJ0_9GAMM|nr:MFS transporter [Panacagrimonas perspica]TDU32401.1 UMF1 family MFS transporter [Panacagrimonas perspica]THD05329.1 MFS transporter [Panacagrimonas perspica]